MDDGPQFSLLRERIEVDYTTPCFPRQDGLVGRMDGSIGKAIQRALNENGIREVFDFDLMRRRNVVSPMR